MAMNFASGTKAWSFSREATDREDGRFSKMTSPLCLATVFAASNPVPEVVPYLCVITREEKEDEDEDSVDKRHHFSRGRA